MFINFIIYFLGLYTQCDKIYQYISRQKEEVILFTIIIVVKNFNILRKFYFCHLKN